MLVTLAHLPLVPWNAGWTGEERYEVRPCRYAGGMLALWQPFAPGSGKPIFAQPHSVRQRKSIAEMRCTVCGEQTPVDDRWWFGLGNVIEGQYATTEAPVHGACADYALQVCPHLLQLGRDPSPMPGGYSIQAALVGGDAFERKFGIKIAGRTVIGSLKLVWPMASAELIVGAR